MGLFCCISGKVGDDIGDPNLIIDVEKVLADAAWRSFKVTYPKYRRRFLNRKNYTIEVPMNYFHFEEITKPRITAKDTPQGIDVTHNSIMAKKNPPSRQLSMKELPGSQHIGLETEFNNDTDEQQTYTFQFEKVRTASVEVSYQKGYTIGGKANFSIGLPSVFGDGSVGFEAEKQLQVTNSKGQKFEESVKTAATSDIVVSKRSRYTASVVMEERNLDAEFKVVMRMSMPAQKAPIYIKEKKTDEAIFCYTITDLPTIFDEFKDVQEVPIPGGGTREDAVDFTIEGVIHGVKLASHKINLYSHPKSTQKEEKDLLCLQDGQDEVNFKTGLPVVMVPNKPPANGKSSAGQTSGLSAVKEGSEEPKRLS